MSARLSNGPLRNNARVLEQGPNEEANIRDITMEARGFLHNGRIGVQGGFSLLSLLFRVTIWIKPKWNYQFPHVGDRIDRHKTILKEKGTNYLYSIEGVTFGPQLPIVYNDTIDRLETNKKREEKRCSKTGIETLNNSRRRKDDMQKQ